MDIYDLKKFFIICTVLLILINLIPIVNIFYKIQPETYLEMALLDDNMNTNNYYPNNNVIPINETINWNIYLSNHMRGIEYLRVKLKFITSNSQELYIIYGLPSLSEAKFEYDVIIPDNEVKITPLSWKISEILNEENNSIIKIIINDKPIEIKILKSNLDNLTMLLELWRYDTIENNFNFAWKNESGTHCVWNQMRVNIQQ